MTLLFIFFSLFQVTDVDHPQTYLADSLRSSGYRQLPSVKPFAKIESDRIVLSFSVVDNPGGRKLHVVWRPDHRNPAKCDVIPLDDVSASATIPSVDGDYFFDLLVLTGTDSVKFQTYVTRDGDKLRAFDIDNDRPTWIDDAVVYQITPNSFIRGGTYDDITAKLPEIRRLGVNTIYFQPVYKTYRGGQGYDVIDFFSLRSDLGTEEQLRRAINVAHEHGMRVIFDFVPNHTSIYHPYAQSVIRDGEASPYYSYYQHAFDGAPYSSHYQKGENGFVHYFWKHLVNLNYDNDEVQRWIIEACKYWLRRFDLDGYRFDAMWAVNARSPSFGSRLRTELKSIKPDILLLAEDKPVASTFSSGFDAAYDWTADTSWVSQWSWQTDYHERESKTVFNYPNESERVGYLRTALFKNGCFEAPCLRFMENNDLPRFSVHHSEAQTKMVAALLFSIPGIPMLYNGQEVGITSHPYTRHTIFSTEKDIRSILPERFDFYRQLIGTRNSYPALRTGKMAEVSLDAEGPVFGFRRWTEEEEFLIIMNIGSKSTTVAVPDRIKERARDALTGKIVSLKRIPVEPFGVRWFLISPSSR